jgi:hypothetical protein
VRRAALTFVLMACARVQRSDQSLPDRPHGPVHGGGRGEPSELPAGFPANPTKIWNFTNAYKLEPAKEPIDSPQGQAMLFRSVGAGVGPLLALADACVRHPRRRLG